MWEWTIIIVGIASIVGFQWTEDDTAYVVQQWQRFDAWTAELLARMKRRQQMAVWAWMMWRTKKRHR